MRKRTPFHSCIARYNETEIWKNWSGYLVAPNLQYSIANEYYAIRNAVSLLDTSPLFKYRFSGTDAIELLSRAMVRDVRKCPPGRAQYTVWCDEDGFVVQDGVLLRIQPNEFLLTAGEPALRWFRQIARQFNLNENTVEDVSENYGILAVQGPHANSVLNQLMSDVDSLSYFTVTESTIANCPVVVSRTGYTGDLGYEIWVTAAQGEKVFEELMKAGAGFNITPIGTTALKMSRVEAGLLLMDVDFYSSRYAWSPAQKDTPYELGFDWMLKGLSNDNREFTGRSAIEKELAEKRSRWTTVGLSIDIKEYEKRFHDAGVIPDKQNVYRETTSSLYLRGKREWEYAGYVSSFLYSSLLKRPIAIGKLPPALAEPGTEVDMEIQVIRKPETVLATVQKLPFFNPKRKTESFSSQEKSNA